VDQFKALVDDLTWDSFIPDFKAIVEHATAVVKPMTTLGTTRPRIPLFWMDTGIILPLYFVAVKCPDRKIRHEAVELLKVDQRQEGVWNRYAQNVSLILHISTGRDLSDMLWSEE
jgi:hypothetical protein